MAHIRIYTSIFLSLLFLFSCNSSNQREIGTTDSNAIIPPASDRVTVTITYKCDDGTKATVVYDNTDPANMTAEVAIADLKKRKMKLVKSASGAKYSDGEMIWWNKGKTGYFMQRGRKGKIIYNNCNEFNAN